jgi:hypothetical protein
MKKRIWIPLAFGACLAAGLACGTELGSSLVSTPSIESLCLLVDQSFPQIPEGYALPTAEVISRVLSGMGIELLSSEASCDATLQIRLTFEAMTEFFTGLMGPSAYCYTMARVEGEMVLEIKSGRTKTVPIARQTQEHTNVVLSSCPSEPSEAPFEGLWADTLVDGLADLWGVSALVEALGDEDPGIRAAAAWELRQLGPQATEAIPALMEALEDTNEGVYSAAIGALGAIGAQARDAVPFIIEALADEDFRVRSEAAWALGEIGQPEAVPALIQALGDIFYAVRANAAEALGKINPPAAEAAPGLVQLLADERWEVREKAAQALGAIGDRSAVPGLIQALGDEEWFIRKVVAEALQSITGQDFGEDAALWTQWWSEQP